MCLWYLHTCNNRNYNACILVDYSLVSISDTYVQYATYGIYFSKFSTIV